MQPLEVPCRRLSHADFIRGRIGRLAPLPGRRRRALAHASAVRRCGGRDVVTRCDLAYDCAREADMAGIAVANSDSTATAWFPLPRVRLAIRSANQTLAMRLTQSVIVARRIRGATDFGYRRQ